MLKTNGRLVAITGKTMAVMHLRLEIGGMT